MIAHAVWLYFRFPLSLRLVEELLLERGIAGRKRWLWRAADQDGYVLDKIVQNRRNTKAAGRLLIRLLKEQGIAPKRVITESCAHMEQHGGRLCRTSNTDPIKG